MTEQTWILVRDSFLPLLTKGLAVTIPLTACSFCLGMVFAFLTAFVQITNIRILRRLARLYVWIFRGTPLLVQLFIIFYGLPSLGVYIDAYPSAILVFSLNTGAYASETMRAAIEAVPKGQLEAGYMVGMNYLQIMFRIILPQALRTAFPPLFNSLIGLVKDTSLAANITIVEMFRSAQLIAARHYEVFALYCEAALIYLIFCTFLSWLQRFLEFVLDPDHPRPAWKAFLFGNRKKKRKKVKH